MDPSEIAAALARIEGGMHAVRLELGGKLDLLNAQAATLSSRSDDHEARLRVIESRPTVTPKQLAGWLTLGLASASTAAPFVLFSLR